MLSEVAKSIESGAVTVRGRDIPIHAPSAAEDAAIARAPEADRVALSAALAAGWAVASMAVADRDEVVRAVRLKFTEGELAAIADASRAIIPARSELAMAALAVDMSSVPADHIADAPRLPEMLGTTALYRELRTIERFGIRLADWWPDLQRDGLSAGVRSILLAYNDVRADQERGHA